MQSEKCRKEITSYLAKSLLEYLNPNRDPRIYLARGVTFDYRTDHAVRVDFMKFQPLNNEISGIEKGDFFCYEIKSSVEDFHSANGHNFLGDYNYYVMPADVYNQVKEEIPYGIGVLTPISIDNPKGFSSLRSLKRSRQKIRGKSATEMLFMMFRSAARDIKY